MSVSQQSRFIVDITGNWRSLKCSHSEVLEVSEQQETAQFYVKGVLRHFMLTYLKSANHWIRDNKISSLYLYIGQ